jgi:hypothetical protein
MVELETELALLAPLADAEDALLAAKQSGDVAGIKAAKDVVASARSEYRQMGLNQVAQTTITQASAGQFGTGAEAPEIRGDAEGFRGSPDQSED